MANPSLHYIGSGRIAPTGDHVNCERFWQNQIAYHAANGYGDESAYNFSGCNEHGIRMEGRGWGRDSAANGVDDDPEIENLGSRALVMLIGSDDVITAQLERCVREFTEEAYLRGMSRPLRPHSDYVSTSCCGDNGRALVDRINAGAAAPALEAPMYDYFATSPWDPTQTQVWWFSVAGHRYVTASEWATITANQVLAGKPAPRPFKGTPEMFNGSRDTNLVPAGGGGPTKFALNLSGLATAA